MKTFSAASSTKPYTLKSLVCFVIITVFFSVSCKKILTTNNQEDTHGDMIVGSYFGVLSPGNTSMSANVSKVSTSQYRFTPVGSLPSFNFQYDALGSLFGSIGNEAYYKVPQQVSNGITIDSTSFTFYKYNNTANFTITSSATTTTWNYIGRRQ